MPTLPLLGGEDPVYIALCDASERFLVVNAPYAARFGLTPADVVGRRMVDVLTSDTYRRISPYVRRVLRGEAVEFVAEVPDGRFGTRRMQASYVPQANADGVVERFIAVIHDASARADCELLRQQAFDGALAAHQMAETANRMTDEFVALLSHELRTPIGSVLGWIRILRDNQLDPETRVRALNAMERSAGATASDIEDLLDVSRVVTGQLRIASAVVDLDALVRRAVDAEGPAALAKNQNLTLSMADAAAHRVMGDATRLQQVVRNVLSNAIRYTPDRGSINVAVFARGSEAHIRVSDTGQGISADVLRYICQRFRRGDGTTTRRHRGLGLGLAIARHLMRLHGGAITAHSDGLGRGATFMITMPLEDALDVPEQLTFKAGDAGRAVAGDPVAGW
jgi:PAS domain S-box-containing protein